MLRLMLSSPLINVMARAVTDSTRTLARDFLEIANLLNSQNGTQRFIKSAEKKVSKNLCQALQKARPEYGILIEGSDFMPGNGSNEDHIWVIDPIDGTNNFANGVPHVACSVALYNKVTKTIIAGVVYDVIRDEIFYAQIGKGAYLDRHFRLKVSNKDDIEGAMIGASLASHTMAYVPKIAPNVRHMRAMGAVSLDLAYVAAGRYEGMVLGSTRPWDVMAGLCLITEAGGTIYDTKGKGIDDLLESTNIVTGNYSISNELVRLIK